MNLVNTMHQLHHLEIKSYYILLRYRMRRYIRSRARLLQWIQTLQQYIRLQETSGFLDADGWMQLTIFKSCLETLQTELDQFSI